MADKSRTQDEALTGLVSYELTMPDTPWFIREVFDILRDLCLSENWEQVGTVTVDEATAAAVDMYIGLRRMVGQIFPVITASVPTNALLCDGTTYNRVDYPALYDALDPAFQLDEDTFFVPDLRGKTVIGASSSHAVASTGGAETHTLSTGEMPVHNHTDSGHLHSIPSTITFTALTGEEPVNIPVPLVPSYTGSASANIQNTGGGEAHNNMQPYIALKYAVVAR